MGVRRLAALASCVLLLASCGGGSSGGAASPSGTPSSSAPPAPPAVTMTIKDHASLTRAVPWQVMATTAGDDAVERVDFLIDGKKLWQEESSPYFFDDDHQLLPPWLLGSGSHVLTAHVATANGATTDAVAHVTVNADLAANTSIVGNYERVVTKADQRRPISYRVAAKGAFGDVSPAGKWKMRIKPNGEIFLTDPVDGAAGVFVEPYTLSGSTVRLYGAAVWRQPMPDPANKYCEPEAVSDYSWALSGSSLTIRNVQKACADRDIVLVGTWTRVGG